MSRRRDRQKRQEIPQLSLDELRHHQHQAESLAAIWAWLAERVEHGLLGSDYEPPALELRHPDGARTAVHRELGENVMLYLLRLAEDAQQRAVELGAARLPVTATLEPLPGSLPPSSRSGAPVVFPMRLVPRRGAACSVPSGRKKNNEKISLELRGNTA